MKKLMVFFALMFVLCAVALALAEPFLVCDPMPDSTNYRIKLSADNGTTWGPWVEGPPVNQAMKFDLSDTPKGNYNGEAQAYGAWKVTDSATGQVSTVTQWTPSAPFLLETPSSMKNIRAIK